MTNKSNITRRLTLLRAWNCKRNHLPERALTHVTQKRQQPHCWSKAIITLTCATYPSTRWLLSLAHAEHQTNLQGDHGHNLSTAIQQNASVAQDEPCTDWSNVTIFFERKKIGSLEQFLCPTSTSLGQQTTDQAHSRYPE